MLKHRNNGHTYMDIKDTSAVLKHRDNGHNYMDRKDTSAVLKHRDNGHNYMDRKDSSVVGKQRVNSIFLPDFFISFTLKDKPQLTFAISPHQSKLTQDQPVLELT